MSFLKALTTSCMLTSTVWAAYDNNLNYDSPSSRHPQLGIEKRKVHARTEPEVKWDPKDLKFTHGVASGDPTASNIVLWTRAAPSDEHDRSNVTVSGLVALFSHENDAFVKMSNAPVCVYFRIATDNKLKNIVDQGRIHTSSDIDYTVKVDAKNLQPFTQYYYQFNICNSDNRSPLGRTKTLPAKDQKVEKNVRLAVYSCSNHPFGYFNAYGNPVRKSQNGVSDLDFVVHLGDYIYEYGNGEYPVVSPVGRIPEPANEIHTLFDYRTRHGQYRKDTDLQALHQNFPIISVGDNTFRDGSSHLQNNEQSFNAAGGISFDQRKMNAVRAYWEWIPIRQVDMEDNLRIFRNFEIGDLMDLTMLDTRNYDRSITVIYTNTAYVNKIKDDAGRSIMGSRQENWFYNTLTQSKKRGARWRLVGNQIVFSRIDWTPVAPRLFANVDQWDGYTANKNRTLRHLYENKIDNTVFLAGDSHASWVSDLVWLDEKPYDVATGQGAIGVEFAGTAVSSPSPIGQNTTLTIANGASKLLVDKNPELQWQDFYYRGYYELEVGYDKIDAKFFGIPSILKQNGLEISLANFTVRAGQNRLERRNGKIAGGVVESGYLKNGVVAGKSIAVDTAAKNP